MTTRLEQRRARLRAEYGFDFPDDFYRIWEFANRLAPLDPLNALMGPLRVGLVGPFEVLAGRFDGRVPRHSLLLHWRYYDDPPEFFTVLSGDSDGLHWGYYLDDPGRSASGCVCHYWARDAYELSADGDTLFEAVRLHLEYLYRDNEEYRAEGAGDAAEYDDALRQLDACRRRLLDYATADRPEVGDAYTERYANRTRRAKAVVAATMEGMGVVVEPGQYRPLSLRGRPLWRFLRRTDDPADLVAEARQALGEGYAGAALALGKDLWATTGPRRTAYACALLDEAYAALGRETLRGVLQTHQAHRDLPSVDILENE